MNNDDFMYSRQEEPRQAFVASLKSQLEQEETASYPFNVHSKRFLRGIASFALLTCALFFISPDARAFVVQVLQIDSWIVVSDEDAQTYLPFAIPQSIPDGYERREQWYDPEGNIAEGDVSLNSLDIGGALIFGHIVWHDDRNNCWMMMTVYENRNSPEIVARSLQQAEDFSRFDWIDVFEIAGMQAIWRIKTQRTGSEFMEIEWISSDNVVHRLQTPSNCMTQEQFTAVAQSVE